MRSPGPAERGIPVVGWGLAMVGLHCGGGKGEPVRVRIRKYLPTMAVAMVTAALTAAAPAIGHGVQHALFAHDSEKVDGKSAVGSRADADKRAGKLVATNAQGRFPPDVLPLRATTVFDHSEPLPFSATFTTSGGTTLLWASASAFRPPSATGAGLIGIDIFVDDLLVSTLRMHANEKISHKTLPTEVIVLNLDAGSHTLRWEEVDSNNCGTQFESAQTNCTEVDGNDRIEATILELPPP